MSVLTEAIVWTLVAPLLCACVLFVAGTTNRYLSCVLACIPSACASAWLVVSVATGGVRSLSLGGWSAPLGIELRADGLTAFMIATTAFVALLIGAYACVRAEPRSSPLPTAFWPLWCFAWLGQNAVFLAGDLFNLYIALEVLGLAAVALVALAGGAALLASFRYALVTLFGSLLFLLGVALLYAEYGTLDTVLLGAVARSTPATVLALVSMTTSLGLKAALFPAHFWLPAAHANALAPVSALLSGLVCHASFYLVVRLWTSAFVPVTSVALSEWVGVLATVGIVWGSVQAIRQRRLKMLIAYSTVAQMGYLFLVVPLLGGVGSAAWVGGAMFVAAHACAKAAMFLAAGTIIAVCGTDEIRRLAGASTRLPLTTFAFAIAGITLVGLPPTAGFTAKWLLLQAAFETAHPFLAFVIVAGTLLTAGYVFIPLARFFRNMPPGTLPSRRASVVAELVTLVLALAGLALGILSHAPSQLLVLGRSTLYAFATSILP